MSLAGLTQVALLAKTVRPDACSASLREGVFAGPCAAEADLTEMSVEQKIAFASFCAVGFPCQVVYVCARIAQPLVQHTCSCTGGLRTEFPADMPEAGFLHRKFANGVGTLFLKSFTLFTYNLVLCSYAFFCCCFFHNCTGLWVVLHTGVHISLRMPTSCVVFLLQSLARDWKWSLQRPAAV